MDEGREVLLEARALTKRYETGVVAVERLDLRVHAGEIYALLGANGAGKTTTINLFLNFIEPTDGFAFLAGINCARDPLAAKKHAAFVSENVMLYGGFTARQNLRFFSELAGRRHTADQLEAATRRVGLPADAFDSRVASYSKGMRQKLGIAIAILKDAPVLLLDEPTSGLDPKAAAEFTDLVRQLRAEGRAILMSTHDLFRARDVADKIGIMKQGRLVAELPAERVRGADLERIYLEYMSSEDAAGRGVSTP